MRFYGPVNDNAVTVIDASILHAIPIHIAIERSFRMTDIVTIEVKSLMPIVSSRRRKPSYDASMLQFQLGVKYTFTYLYIAHFIIVFPSAKLGIKNEINKRYSQKSQFTIHKIHILKNCTAFHNEVQLYLY